MNDLQKRFALFLIGCMGARLSLAIIAKNINTKYLKYMGYLLLLPAFGFMFIYLTGIRNTGKGAFGEKIWWKNLRPLHAILYLLFSINAINGNRNSWLYLLLDVFIGLIAFLFNYFYKK